MKNENASDSQFQGVLAHRSRAAELAVGLAAKQLTEVGFDYLLYPFVVYRLGVVYGGTVMMALSALACLLIIRFYDWSGRDWLGIEAVKGLKGYVGKSRAARVAGWFLRKSDPVIFLFLSVKFDPFMTMAYLRHGAFNGMSRRDWWIFGGSIVVSNAYWTLACYLGISVVEWAWRAVKGVW